MHRGLSVRLSRDLLFSSFGYGPRVYCPLFHLHGFLLLLRHSDRGPEPSSNSALRYAYDHGIFQDHRWSADFRFPFGLHGFYPHLCRHCFLSPLCFPRIRWSVCSHLFSLLRWPPSRSYHRHAFLRCLYSHLECWSQGCDILGSDRQGGDTYDVNLCCLRSRVRHLWFSPLPYEPRSRFFLLSPPCSFCSYRPCTYDRHLRRLLLGFGC